MRTKKNKVYLTEAERNKLKEISNKGKASAKIIKRANILLSLDENVGKVKTQAEIAQIYQCNPALVHTVAEQYIDSGLTRVITRKKRETPPIPSKFTGEIEAQIIKLACSEPPEGHSRWSLQLLADETVRLKILDSVSDNGIRSILKKHRLSLTRKKNGAYLPNKTRRS